MFRFCGLKYRPIVSPCISNIVNPALVHCVVGQARVTDSNCHLSLFLVSEYCDYYYCYYYYYYYYYNYYWFYHFSLLFNWFGHVHGGERYGIVGDLTNNIKSLKSMIIIINVTVTVINTAIINSILLKRPSILSRSVLFHLSNYLSVVALLNNETDLHFRVFIKSTFQISGGSEDGCADVSSPICDGSV